MLEFKYWKNKMTTQQQTEIDLNKHYSEAFKRIIQINNDNQLCDVTLICKNDFKIKSHRIILCAVSDYFHAMFITSNLAEAFKNEIQMNHMDGNALKSLIDFIYSGCNTKIKKI